MNNIKIVTIWNTYGPYHIARVQALQKVFPDASVICFSHCATNRAEYPFFNLTPKNGEVIVQKDQSDLSFRQSFISTLRLLKKHEPVLILACGYERPETLAAVIYARWHHKTCFLMVENQYEDRRRKRSIEFVKYLYLKLFDGCVYGGLSQYRYLVRLGMKPDIAVSGYACVDNDAIARKAEEIRAK